MTLFSVTLLVLIAAIVTAILLIRSISLDSNNTTRSAGANGFRFFLGWVLAGVPVALVTFVMLLFAGMGGVSTPPDSWMIFYSLGIFVLPVLLTLGGVPAAIKIAKGMAWKKTALNMLVVCIASWLLIVGVVFFGPFLFGWSW